MQKRFFSKLCILFTAILLHTLSACTLTDMIHDSFSREKPAPMDSPYGQKVTGKDHAGQFNASHTDRMVTDMSMKIVTNAFAGNSVKTVQLSPEMQKDSPCSKKALVYAQEVFRKLIRSGLLYCDKNSEYTLITSIQNNKWTLTCTKKGKKIFSGSLLFSGKSSPDMKK